MRHIPELSGALWRASSYSNANGGECVEVADGFPGVVPVRDSKDPTGPVLLLRAPAWDEFVTSLKHGA
ncbi:DUF397 domain-containing protein [Streptomyces sp. NBC_01754]|uniref:DUF397 domain-containing protein n=1 Tax=Streptomyces sp. NBC_01754 TaxID=2975930 RepID=UPI002DD7A6DE|nr:DUF397 domain-containing protein [Streptomyces sp. NBC_01754]WSC92086.1 DUF397 domain-containing protein [Streptomyces sp. NBC_01754]